MFKYICVYTQVLYTYMLIYTFIHSYTYNTYVHIYSPPLSIYKYIYICKYIYTDTHMHTHYFHRTSVIQYAKQVVACSYVLF